MSAGERPAKEVRASCPKVTKVGVSKRIISIVKVGRLTLSPKKVFLPPNALIVFQINELVIHVCTFDMITTPPAL